MYIDVDRLLAPSRNSGHRQIGQSFVPLQKQGLRDCLPSGMAARHRGPLFSQLAGRQAKQFLDEARDYLESPQLLVTFRQELHVLSKGQLQDYAEDGSQ